MGAGLKLLFDLSAAQPLRFGAHGAGEYARSVFRVLAPRAGGRLVAYAFAGAPLDDEMTSVAASAGVEVCSVADRNGLQQLVRERSPERVYSALPYELGAVDFGRAEFVGTIHGLRPIEMPADSSAWRYSRNASDLIKAQVRLAASSWYIERMRRRFAALLAVRAAARRFIVPSEYTRASLLQHFPGIDAGSVHVLYSPKTAMADVPQTAQRLPDFVAAAQRRYLLLVSGDRWVKNSYRALRAIEQVLAALPAERRWAVVVTGNCPRFFPHAWREAFRFAGRCSDEELAGLYANAGLFVYPSLNEGFGYPPLEAMSYATPVLAAAIAATPEISAEGAGYFNPLDIADMRTRIAAALSDPFALAEWGNKARQRYLVVSARQAHDLDALCNLLLA
jgi:glycosyltransferase involved in cell wall biosynthesis